MFPLVHKSCVQNYTCDSAIVYVVVIGSIRVGALISLQNGSSSSFPVDLLRLTQATGRGLTSIEFTLLIQTILANLGCLRCNLTLANPIREVLDLAESN